MHGSMGRQPTDDPGCRLRRAGRLGLQQAAWTGTARRRRLLRLELRGRPDQPLAAGRRLRARNVGCLDCRRSPNADAAICQSLGSGGVRAFVESAILRPVKKGNVRHGDHQHVFCSQPKADSVQRGTSSPDSLSDFPTRMELTGSGRFPSLARAVEFAVRNLESSRNTSISTSNLSRAIAY